MEEILGLVFKIGHGTDMIGRFPWKLDAKKNKKVNERG
jgi:hypothetical protein